MWKALRSDLKEFVSSVAEDSTVVLEKIDGNVKVNASKTEVDNEDHKSSADDSSALNNASTNVSAKQQEHDDSFDFDDNAIISEDNDMAYLGSSMELGYEATGVVSNAADEVSRRMGLEETYIQPLLADEVNGVKKEQSQTDVTQENQAVKKKCEPEGESTRDNGGERESDGDVQEQNTNTFEDRNSCLSEDVNQSEVEESNEETHSFIFDDGDQANVRSYLESFDVESKTDEIAMIIASHPSTVGAHFENLVPLVVTYEQFWQRFFYRCDAARIQKEWDEEEERLRKERKELIDKGVKSVKNLFGGALKVGGGALQALREASKKEDQRKSIYEKYQAEVEEQQRAIQSKHDSAAVSDGGQVKSIGLGMSLFGSGRPPFVMNTAESGDEDEEVVGNEEGSEEESYEDEEEFGWGSEEEEDSDDDGDVEGSVELNNSNVTTEQEILFEAGATKSDLVDSEELIKLREELAQIALERDQLFKTVEMQSREIDQLKASSETSEKDGVNSEVERLQMVVFEKDAELAALKASLDDTHEEGSKDKRAEAKIQTQARDMERLAEDLCAKDGELNKFRVELAKVASEKEQILAQNDSITKELIDSKNSIAQLKAELDVALKNVNKLDAENINISQSHIDFTSEIEALKNDKAASEEEINRLILQLELAKSTTKESDEKLAKLSNELKSTKCELKEQSIKFARTLEDEIEKVRSEFSTTMPPFSSASQDGDSKTESSLSSGVQVPSEHAIAKKNSEDEDDEDEDDWGGGWGDDDE